MVFTIYRLAALFTVTIIVSSNVKLDLLKCPEVKLYSFKIGVELYCGGCLS
jgi:hypothetical protein